MPKTTVPSGLLAGMGRRLVDAFDFAKGKSVELNFGGQLPGGIENGVAQLRELKIGQYAPDTKLAGKPYFLGQAVVIFPVELSGQKIAGLFTRIGPEPLCDTLDRAGQNSRKSFQDHFDWMVQHLKQLGWRSETLQARSAQEMESFLLAAMKALCQTAPYFRFRTWKGKKTVIERDADGKLYCFDEDDKGNRKRIPGKGPYLSEQVAKVHNPYAGRDPLVQHVWGEVLPGYRPAPRQDVQDDTGDDFSTSYTPANNGSGSAGTDAASFNEFPEKDAPREEDKWRQLLDELVQRAEARDEQAQDELNERALNAGWSHDDVLSATNWNAVAAMIRNPRRHESTDANDEEDAPSASAADSGAPAVGSVMNYRPLDAKTKKPARRLVECEVMAVDASAKTAELKSLRDGKTVYAAVPWNALES